MKVKVNRWAAIAAWKWDLGKEDDGSMDDESEEDLCGICRLNYESCCPDCKIPGDDCPLIWGKCSHVFHMHCLLKWIATPSSKSQCPMDRRPWETAQGSVNRAMNPT